MTERKISLVAKGKDFERLDKILISHIFAIIQDAQLTRSQLKQMIEKGCASVNGKVVTKAGALIASGSCITLEIPLVEPHELEPYKFHLSIMYEDDEIIVIDKPSGLSMHPGAGNRTTTLVNALIYHFGPSKPDLFREGVRPGIVHRLDRDTTGVVVVAKTAAMHASLAKQFAKRSVDRFYTALVLSTPRAKGLLSESESGALETQIGRDPRNRKRMAVMPIGGKTAKTSWVVEERMTYGMLLTLKLGTGRTHQIRVHMSHLNSPVIGDKTYGDFSALPSQLKLAAGNFGRQALHAKSLEFTHPKTHKRLVFESLLPKELASLIQRFREVH